MQLRCPVSSAHVLVQVADGLFQCPDCGAGPEFWSIGYVEVDGDTVGGLCASWRPDLEAYALSHMSWTVDRQYRRTAASLMNMPVGVARTAAELAETPLPVRSSAANTVTLRESMFRNPFGEKIVHSGERTGTSGAERARAESSEGSRPHRRKVGE